MNMAELRNSQDQRAGHNSTPIVEHSQTSPDRGQLIDDDEDEDESPEQLDRGFRSNNGQHEEDDIDQDLEDDDMGDDYVDDFEQFGEEAQSPTEDRKMIQVVTNPKPQQ